ncbi:sulfite exporter TauE/SafE family protein [Marinobacter hydrocarbonoclasticus]|nr:sulfite exporter TauE/SafE family protein [Marinobacter nauticus]
MEEKYLVPIRRRFWSSTVLLIGAALLFSATTFPLLTEFGHFSLLGLLGALVANSTGAGGGVVFIPAFNQLNLPPDAAVATSFAIQCFGMTAGAAAWYRHARNDAVGANQGVWGPLLPAVGYTLAGTLPGLIAGRALPAPSDLHALFSLFSVALGALILLLSFRALTAQPRQRLAAHHPALLVALGAAGGVITAWLSVGVGELLVIFLILLRCHSATAVAAGVMVSAITVWFAMVLNLLQGAPIHWSIVLFAGPAAVVGGVVARKLATVMSPLQLKRFFACWILFVGLVG